MLWTGWDELGMVWMWLGMDGMRWLKGSCYCCYYFSSIFQVLLLIGRKKYIKTIPPVRVTIVTVWYVDLSAGEFVR